MLVRDLLTESDLGLVLLAGEQYLERPVRGVCITDLVDSRRYLAGGEVVLNGLVWHAGPVDSERFVAAPAEVGVSALVAGAAWLGHNTPPDLVEAAERHGLPLLEVLMEINFSTLTEECSAHTALGCPGGW